MPRKYQQKRRAEQQAETRQRIIEAAIELHQTIGRAPISAIAARAEVERLTVYRHFPDERSLFTACTSHYAAQHPFPDPTRWQEITEPETRLRTALGAVYAYHRETEQMSKQTVRGLEEVPVLREVLAPMFAYWEQVAEMLRAGWTVDGAQGRLVDAAVRHALSFQAWHALVRGLGLSEADAIELMVGMVGCSARTLAER